MTEQAKNILLSAAAEIETMYNQGILDGITLIRNMIETRQEDTVWTPELIKDTCDAFIAKYSSDEDRTAKIPDVPNLADEIPQECTNAGMSAEAYNDLMCFLNEASDEYEINEYTITENEESGFVHGTLEEVEKFGEGIQETGCEYKPYISEDPLNEPVIQLEDGRKVPLSEVMEMTPQLVDTALE